MSTVTKTPGPLTPPHDAPLAAAAARHEGAAPGAALRHAEEPEALDDALENPYDNLACTD